MLTTHPFAMRAEDILSQSYVAGEVDSGTVSFNALKRAIHADFQGNVGDTVFLKQMMADILKWEDLLKTPDQNDVKGRILSDLKYYARDTHFPKSPDLQKQLNKQWVAVTVTPGEALPLPERDTVFSRGGYASSELPLLSGEAGDYKSLTTSTFHMKDMDSYAADKVTLFLGQQNIKTPLIDATIEDQHKREANFVIQLMKKEAFDLYQGGKQDQAKTVATLAFKLECLALPKRLLGDNDAELNAGFRYIKAHMLINQAKPKLSDAPSLWKRIKAAVSGLFGFSKQPPQSHSVTTPICSTLAQGYANIAEATLQKSHNASAPAA